MKKEKKREKEDEENEREKQMNLLTYLRSRRRSGCLPLTVRTSSRPEP